MHARRKNEQEFSSRCIDLFVRVRARHMTHDFTQPRRTSPCRDIPAARLRMFRREKKASPSIKSPGKGNTTIVLMSLDSFCAIHTSRSMSCSCHDWRFLFFFLQTEKSILLFSSALLVCLLFLHSSVFSPPPYSTLTLSSLFIGNTAVVLIAFSSVFCSGINRQEDNEQVSEQRLAFTFPLLSRCRCRARRLSLSLSFSLESKFPFSSRPLVCSTSSNQWVTRVFLPPDKSAKTILLLRVTTDQQRCPSDLRSLIERRCKTTATDPATTTTTTA